MAQQLPPEVEQLLAQTPDPQDRFEIMLNYNRRQNPAEFDRQLRSGPMAGRVKPDQNGWLTFKAPHESWLARNSWILGAAGLGTAAALGLAGVGAGAGSAAAAGGGTGAGAAAGAAGGVLPSTVIGSGFVPAVGLPSGTAMAAGSGMGAAAAGLGRAASQGAVTSQGSRLGRGVKALAGLAPAAVGMASGGSDGGSPSQGLNELLQQIPQLREMLDLQLNQAKRQDPLHEAVTKMSMNLLPNSARKNYS